MLINQQGNSCYMAANSSFHTFSSELCFFEQDCDWTISHVKDIGKLFRNDTLKGPEMEFEVPKKDKSYASVKWKICMQILDGSCLRFLFEYSCESILKFGMGIIFSLIDTESKGIIGQVDKKKKYILRDGIGVSSHKSFDKYTTLVDVNQSSVTQSMKVICNVKVFQLDRSAVQLSAPLAAPHHDHLGQALNKDRKDGLFTDAALKLGDKEYKVHKVVLGLQSDFFKARFSEHWKENRPNSSVDMNDSDLNHELLECLLTCAYTEKVATADDAMKLLPITDKYQFHQLQLICEEMILNKVDPENILSYLILANQYRASTLEKKCFEVCLHHIVAIKKTEEWSDFITSEEHPDIKHKLYKALLQ